MTLFEIIILEVEKAIQIQAEKYEDGTHLGLDDVHQYGYTYVYRNLLKKYSEKKILRALKDGFTIRGVKLRNLDFMGKVEIVKLIACIYELLPRDYSLVGEILSLAKEGTRVGADLLKNQGVSLLKIIKQANSKTLQAGSTVNYQTNNDIQEAYRFCNHYLYLCEGIYSKNLSLLVIYIDAIERRERSLDRVNSFSEKDKLTIIGNYSQSLRVRVECGYNSIIRNAIAHEGISLDKFPIIELTNTNKQGVTTVIEVPLEEMITRCQDLFSLANAIQQGLSMSFVFSKKSVFHTEIIRNNPEYALDHTEKEYQALLGLL